MQVFRSLSVFQRRPFYCLFLKRNCSNSVSPPLSEVIERSNYLFSQEQRRQLEEVGRIGKITVEVSAPPEDVVLVMNQDVSTPYDCCRHISLPLSQQTPLALINNEILWDMHRPLPGNCSLKFLSFKDKDPYSLNQAFWRTGSFILGAIITRAFKDSVTVHLHSFPPAWVKSGSFVYDVFLNIARWKPKPDELKVLSAEFLKFVHHNHKIERLSVKKPLAMEIFKGNPFKQSQIPSIAGNSEDNLVTLYRVADHIDISSGPMIGDTSFFGRVTVTAVFEMIGIPTALYRFQAVALPKGIMLNQFAYGVIEDRGRVLNEAEFPNLPKKSQQPYFFRPDLKNSNRPVSLE